MELVLFVLILRSDRWTLSAVEFQQKLDPSATENR
jgi:hypothetical protein